MALRSWHICRAFVVRKLERKKFTPSGLHPDVSRLKIDCCGLASKTVMGSVKPATLLHSLTHSLAVVSASHRHQHKHSQKLQEANQTIRRLADGRLLS